jgi:hypothetical protein
MRIYGRTIKEIFALLHWTQKITVIAGTAFIVFAILYILSLGLGPVIDGSAGRISKPLVIKAGDNVGGFLDPSIVVTNDSALLAFTAVSSTPAGELDTSVYIARGNKDCGDFFSASPVLTGKAEDLLAPDGETVIIKGKWRVETPALLHDPADTKSPWKLFATRYFWSDDVNKAPSFARAYAVITKSTSPDALQNKWGREEWILSADKDRPPFPYAPLVKQTLNSLSPDLSAISFYARPSVIIVNDVYFMSLSAFVSGKAAPDRIILLASPDRGNTWSYVGTALADSEIAPYKMLLGATLIQDKGRIYLAAVLGDEKVAGQGTFLFGFESLTKARLIRNEKGTPAVLQHIPLSSVAFSATGGGFATFDSACTGGIITSEFSNLRNSFQIFETGRRISE